MSKNQQNHNFPYLFLGLITGLLPVWMILLGLDAIGKLSHQTGISLALVTVAVVIAGVIRLAFGERSKLS